MGGPLSFKQQAKLKPHALKQLQIVAAVDQDYPRQIMSRKRLERWVELL